MVLLLRQYLCRRFSHDVLYGVYREASKETDYHLYVQIYSPSKKHLASASCIYKLDLRIFSQPVFDNRRISCNVAQTATHNNYFA